MPEYKHLDILAPGDVILTRGTGWKDYIIRLLQGFARKSLKPSLYSHAAICSGPKTVVDADIFKPVGTRYLDHWLTDVSFDDAVVFRRPSPISQTEICHSISTTTISYESDKFYTSMKRNDFHNIDFAIQSRYFVGHTYNWLFFKKKIETRKSFFCSEFIVTLMRQIDDGFFDLVPEKILPIDLPMIFLRAGWRQIKLRDLQLFLQETSKAEPTNKIIMSEAAADAFKKHPQLIELIEQINSQPDLKDDLRQLLDMGAICEIEMEPTKLLIAKQMNDLIDAQLNFIKIICEMIIQAENFEEKKAIYDKFDMPLNFQEMSNIAEWLNNSVRAHSYKIENVCLEKLEGQDSKVIILRHATVGLQLARVSLFNEDIELMSKKVISFKEIVDAIKEGLPVDKQLATNCIVGLLNDHPHLLDLDSEFGRMFVEKIKNCEAAIEEADANNTRTPEILRSERYLLLALKSVARGLLFAQWLASVAAFAEAEAENPD